MPSFLASQLFVSGESMWNLASYVKYTLVGGLYGGTNIRSRQYFSNGQTKQQVRDENNLPAAENIQYMTFNKSIICWTPSIICWTGSIIWWTEGPSYDGPRPRYDGWGPSYDGYHFSSNLLNLWFSVAQELKNSYSNFTVKFCFWYLILLPSYSYLSGFGWFGVHHIMDLVHHIMAPLSII